MTMQHRDLLIEIGTEELPPKALATLRDAFADAVTRGLFDAGLTPAGHEAYAAPRRLAVLVRGVSESTPERRVERRGPALQAAFDDNGCATPAAQGFARSCGVSVEELEQLRTDKGAWLTHTQTEPGQPAAALIPGLIERALAALPIPKRMRWGALSAEFVRPVHWVVCLFGDEVIDANILAVKTGRETRGHRFHAPAPIYIGRPDEYAALLKTQGHVMVDFDERRTAIRAQVEAAAHGLGGRAVIDEALLDEVSALVEWPVAVTGGFEARFLDVPAEALISTMQGNQKYFPVVDAEGRLMPHFITVANIVSRDESEVRAGNERVIRPRFADAEFFWREDRKQPLIARLESLKTVVFQQKLGTLYDKTERVEALAQRIAGDLGADPLLAARAAKLSKCDLQTSMVGEFPELQGVMGRYYARHDGEPEAVAVALDEQYLPRRAGDALPGNPIAQAVALADKLDTLIGIFAIGQGPTGAKDPFALRRAALGVLRIVIERALPLDLDALLHAAARGLQGKVSAADSVLPVFDFMTERLRAYYLDRGIRHDVFDAVVACRPTRPHDFDLRVNAVNAFLELPQAEALAAANKRIQNILRKHEGELPTEVDTTLLTEGPEYLLFDRIEAAALDVGPLFEAGDYTTALAHLAHLREPVDAFFDGVMVMADDPAVRANRLALLGRLGALFMRTADLSLLSA